MKTNKLSKYSIAKNISYEILIEEQLELESEATSKILLKYRKKTISLKLKFISYKIINGLIFVFLPIFSLIAFLNITNSLINAEANIQTIIFIQSLTFQIFFILEFFNFFLMGVFNLINLMSSEIFEWFKTLPFSRKELKKIALLTIIHNFDILILVNIIAFPITVFVFTRNLFVFLISIGCSVLNIMFSITILIIIGEKIAKVIKLKNKKLRKSLLIQILNIFSYAIIIFGSIFVIQVILSSLINIVMMFANLNHSPYYNLVMSFIPFPSSSSYLICLFINSPELIVSYWLSPLFGMGLYLIIIYFLFKKSMKSIDNLLLVKDKFKELNLLNQIYPLEIHTLSPIKAYIRKDLLMASRNLQTFMYFIMPIILSIVFISFFNMSYTIEGVLLDGDFFYIWLVIIGISPVISGTMVYNILNIENTGKSIVGALPILNRDQAKAKLVIMITIQFIATITPSFIYILHPKFIDLILTVLETFPFVLIFLTLIFLLRVRFFGKKNFSYVLDEKSPENKTIKWILIYFIIYLLYFFFVSIAYFLYFYFDFYILLLSFIIISFTIMAFIVAIFNKFFPKSKIRDLIYTSNLLNC